jgi:hypothetical protein
VRKEKPQLHWFDLVCMNCSKKILSIQGVEYLGGWISHMSCGYETLFSPATSGVCPQIATRPLAPANHNQASYNAL